MSIPNEMTFLVAIPTENGFLGRECNSPLCRKYFKVHRNALRDEMYCPYCGDQFPKSELFSTEQREFLRKVAVEEANAIIHKEFAAMMSKAFSGLKSTSFRPGSPYLKQVPAPPKEREVDSELTCPACQGEFQVLGIFGLCPVCRSENIRLYDANWAIIRLEIEQSDNRERALRHAYADLVSTFESFCRKRAARVQIEKGRFQNLDHTRQSFRDKLGIDIFEGIAQLEIRTLKRVFEKRNVTEHNDGLISQRYIEQIPEDASLLGTKVDLSIQELDEAAKILKNILDKIV